MLRSMTVQGSACGTAVERFGFKVTSNELLGGAKPISKIQGTNLTRVGRKISASSSHNNLLSLSLLFRILVAHKLDISG